MTKKTRKEIPNDLAAKVLFYSDRTCCVCKNRTRPIQIHHIDENPSNNTFENLSVLCLDCHNDTMIKGGFGRKLNADQVILYRNDWINKVRKEREEIGMRILDEKASDTNSNFIEYITSVSEIYREKEQYFLLVSLYHSIGNIELRDKYIELCIERDPSDSNICFMRGKQGKPELIPEDVKKRRFEVLTDQKNYLQRARYHIQVGSELEAVKDYITGVNGTLDKNHYFTSAYYLKEMFKGNLIESLFELALKEASENNDLWWQVRALQELGWESELKDLLIKNSDFINESGNSTLKIQLAKAMGDSEEFLRLRKEVASKMELKKVTLKNNK